MRTHPLQAIQRSSLGDVGCSSPTFPTIGQVVGYLLALRQSPEPCASYPGVVHQEVLPAVVGGYETISLFPIEPLDGSFLGHASKLPSFFDVAEVLQAAPPGVSAATRRIAKASNATVATYLQRS
jgi:hypothetical protein